MIHTGELTDTLSASLKYQLRKLYSSVRFSRMVALPRRFIVFAKQWRNKPIFSVEIRGTFGFFAILQVVLFILTYCKERNLVPNISARGGLYGDPAGRVDWFAHCFERIKSYGPEIEERIRRKRHISTAKVFNVRQLGFRRRYEDKMDLTEASQLFRDYYRPSFDILRVVDSAAGKLSISPFTLGVHYRGTDKVLEAGRVSWEIVADAIKRTLTSEPRIANILVSSDELQFLDYIRQQGFPCPIHCVPSSHLSVNGKPVHFSGHDGLQIGREALVASLLLSRCGFLIKTASYLSAWSKIFNPELKVLLISPPGIRPIWFPDAALWDSQRSETGEARSIPAFGWYWQDVLTH
jgi:hypothetical protein